MQWFFHSNEANARLLRTIVQGVIGALIAALTYYVAFMPEWAVVVVVPVVMAILSPIMAEIGKGDGSDDSYKIGGSE